MLNAYKYFISTLVKCIQSLHFNYMSVFLVGKVTIHFDNPLRSLTKETLITLSFYNLPMSLISPLINAVISLTGLLLDMMTTSTKNKTHLNQTIIALYPISTFFLLFLLIHTGQMRTLQTLTIDHLLLNFPMSVFIY